jgi:hypothetical protein
MGEATCAARLTETAHEAGATNPEQLGEQLALLLDGASARNRVLNDETSATAIATAIATVLVGTATATVLVGNAIPTTVRSLGAGESPSE